MASSLNLLVLRLVQFHSENGLAGISALLGRNEEDLIAAAIAEHRASIQMQQRNRIYSNNYNLAEHKRFLNVMKTYSFYSSSQSTESIESNFDWVRKHAHERSTCSLSSIFLCRKRRRRQWLLRRPPQNIKHLLDFHHFVENHRYAFARKSYFPASTINNHLAEPFEQRKHRISIWWCDKHKFSSWKFNRSIWDTEMNLLEIIK